MSFLHAITTREECDGSTMWLCVTTKGQLSSIHVSTSQPTSGKHPNIRSIRSNEESSTSINSMMPGARHKQFSLKCLTMFRDCSNHSTRCDGIQFRKLKERDRGKKTIQLEGTVQLEYINQVYNLLITN